MLLFDCAVCSDVGIFRTCNEDNFYLDGKWQADINACHIKWSKLIRGQVLCGVFDGMGGEAHGECASMALAETFAQYKPSDFPQHIPDCMRAASLRMRREKLRLGAGQMGSTLAGLALQGNQAVAFNLGDSRIYHYCSGLMTQLSEDHTYAQRLLDMGLPCQARDYSTLTQFIGVPEEEMRLEPTIFQVPNVKPRDRFLLCSDGVSSVLGADELAGLLRSPSTAATAAQCIVQCALEAGSTDNTTALVILVSKGRFVWRER